MLSTHLNYFCIPDLYAEHEEFLIFSHLILQFEFLSERYIIPFNFFQLLTHADIHTIVL